MKERNVNAIAEGLARARLVALIRNHSKATPLYHWDKRLRCLAEECEGKDFSSNLEFAEHVADLIMAVWR